MKMLLRTGFIALIVMVILSACQDMLTKAPSDGPSSITFYSNEQELVASINGAYRIIWALTHRSQPIGAELDAATDLGWVRQGDMNLIVQGGHSSTTNVFSNLWGYFYSGISRSNNLLDNMSKARENVSEDLYERIQAEARFLRAFHYHYLVELYGDVPLLTSVPPVEEAYISRTPKAAVVDQIFEDLDFAAEILPVSWSGDDEGRATRGAALALKARVALFNGMFDMAAVTAKEVMDSGEYSLYPDYEGLFQYEGERSSEVIFDVPYQRGTRVHSLPRFMGTRNAQAVSTNAPSQFLVDSYIATDGESIDESSVYDPSNPFENRDPRLDASIVRPGSIFKGYVFETHPDSTETTLIENDSGRRVTNQDVTNPFATFTGYIWRKYNPEEDFPEFQRESSLNWILIRYGEVLLTYAEAKIESGAIDQTVLDAMNQVRARGFGVDPSATNQYPAITTTNQEELRRILRIERKVELALEGFRYFDIRRWGIADKITNANGGYLIGRPIGNYSEITAPPVINQETGHPDYGNLQSLYRNVEPRSFNPNRDWLWPIPQNELDVNDNLTQNPGY